MQNFDISLSKMTPLRPMADSYSVGDSKAEWPNNVLSNLTEVYEDGKIGKHPTPVVHNVCPEELEHCRRLSMKAAQVAEMAILLSETDCHWAPFFVTTNIEDRSPSGLTPDLIKEMFAGNIFPGTTVWVDSLSGSGPWREEIFEEEDEYANSEYLEAWKSLLAWFNSHPGILSPAYVRIGDDRSMGKIPETDYPPGTEMTGSCFPRLILGLTRQGSVVGLVGHVVLT